MSSFPIRNKKFCFFIFLRRITFEFFFFFSVEHLYFGWFVSYAARAFWRADTHPAHIQNTKSWGEGEAFQKPDS